VRHNAKEFDIPFLARRMIINQIALPDKLNLQETMEIPHLDTLELWKFGITSTILFKINVKYLVYLSQRYMMVVKWDMFL
jgi:hypothetical protein